MKKMLLPAVVLLAINHASAQYDANTAQDPVKYAMDNLTGTARFRAMGGAFGALGGDPSAVSINPAGSSIYNYNTFSTTISSYNNNNKASFFGTNTTKNDNNFDLNQLGVFLVFNNSKENAFINKFAFGFNYENTQSFDNTVNIVGVNPTGSIANYFLHYANGFGNSGAVPLSVVESPITNFPNLSYVEQQAYLGYQGFAVNPATNSNAYVANLPAGSANHYQDSYISSTGFNGKVALNFSAQAKQKLSVGGNVNVHFTDYIKTTNFIEDTNNATGSGLEYTDFTTRRYTYGGGVSFNMGAIYSVSRSVRLGAAYESPTWLTLQDELNQYIYSSADGSTPYADPGMIMVSDTYTIQLPSKYTGSAAFIFGKRGLLSIDYGIRNYANVKYMSSRYSALNNELSQTLDWAGDLRVGTEWRVKMVSIRGGYRYQQSPYKTLNTLGNINSISGGLGYSFGSNRIDLAYTWQQRKNNVSTLVPGLSDSAPVKTTGNNITLSYTLDL